MIFKIYKITLFFIVLNLSPIYGQSQSDAEKQQEAYEKKMLEELDALTNEFLSQLEVDDFQKEIIKQKIQSYYQERKTIYLDTSLKYFERDEKLSALFVNHFSDIKDLVSEDTMKQIQSFVKDGGAAIKKEKKKKKKKKD